MNGPGIIRAVSAESTETLRKAIAGLTMMTRENIRLRAEIADRDEKIRTLQEMLNRAYVDTQRPGAP